MQMFGNTIGWIISAAIIGLASLFTYGLVQAGIPTSPTGVVDSTLKPLTLAAAAEPFMKVTDTNGDAARLYENAIKDYNNHLNDYDALQHTSDYTKAKVAAAKLQGLSDLVKASNTRFIGLFASDPTKIINSDEHPDELEALEGVTRTAGMLSVLAKSENDYQTARDYARAILVLGVRLYQERLADLELEKGETMIGTGIDALSEIDHADPAGGASGTADDAFKTAYTNETNTVKEPIVKLLRTISEASIGEHAGDMFQIATGSNYDRVWRVEAIHRLGRLKRNAENKADQIKANRVLTELSSDPREDAIIHLAAQQAVDMTEGDDQSQR